MLFFFRRGREQASPTVLWWSMSRTRCAACQGQQRRLNYVPDANMTDCSVPLASSIHLSASLKIPLMRYRICICSHFEYGALSSRKRDRRSVSSSFSLSFPFSSRLVASRFRAFPPSFTPRDGRESMFSYGTSRIDRRSNLDQRSEEDCMAVERSSRNNSTRIHDFSANKRARIVPID